MEQTIYDYVVAKELAAYWDTTLEQQGTEPYLLATLFPDRKKVGLNLKYIKGAAGLPTELNLSAFDAKSIKKERIGFSSVQTEMPFFKNDMAIDETTRQELLIAIESGNDLYIDTLLTNIFDDVTNLLKYAAVTREKMRGMLLSTGTITLANNGQEATYNYGLDNTQGTGQFQTPSTLWSSSSANPVDDIIAWQDNRENAGFERPTRAITSRKVLRNLMKNDGIKNAIYVFGQGKVSLTEEAVKNYIYENTGVTIEVYDKKYKNLQGTTTRFIPEDLFILIPEGDLGFTWFGTTPEEADLRSSKIANVSIVDTGVAITTTEVADPVTVDTKVSQVTLPSFEAADKIIIADVI